jgi:general secretion pathway protein E
MPVVSPDDLNIAFLRPRGVRLAAGPQGNAEEQSASSFLTAAEPDADTVAALSFAVGAPLGPADFAVASADEQASGVQWGDEATWHPECYATSVPAWTDSPIVSLVERLLVQAARQHVSDIHIEPMEQSLSIRYRIDGQLVEVERHPASLAQSVATRVKVMASLDIAESRLPQDGRLQVQFQGRAVDVRVATTPIAFGESIVLRILGRTEVPLDLDRLGLGVASVETLKQALARPHGIALITGPTGSGKTTTLYAALSRLRRPEVKILTVEDPIEVLLEGVNQVQVRPDIHLDYPRTLRAFLRQDPDILMVGEIRDGETAEIAMRAALTGHLVLSTLHTNTAIGAFTRLRDIGVEPYLTASTVVATAAQRLVRTLCLGCSTSRPLTPSELALFVNHGLIAPDTVPVPQGCPTCQSKGYKGRQPVMEIIAVDDRLREAIRDGTFERQNDWVAPSQSLLGQGLALVAAGRTTLEELQRAIGAA